MFGDQLLARAGPRLAIVFAWLPIPERGGGVLGLRAGRWVGPFEAQWRLQLATGPQALEVCEPASQPATKRAEDTHSTVLAGLARSAKAREW